MIGVVNVTPDSFSDGGRYLDVDDAIRTRLQMHADGADLIDVGGESTRPGAQRVDGGGGAAAHRPGDRRLGRARRADLGGHLPRRRSPRPRWRPARAVVNDVSGGLGDPDMARGGARRGLPVDPHALARAQRADAASWRSTTTSSTTSATELLARVDAAVAAGVDRVGVGHRPGARASRRPPSTTGRCCAALESLVEIGLPVLVAASRKSFLGALLADPDGTPRAVDEREDATTALTAYCAAHGVWGVRVHEVRPSVDAARTVAAIASDGWTNAA